VINTVFWGRDGKMDMTRNLDLEDGSSKVGQNFIVEQGGRMPRALQQTAGGEGRIKQVASWRVSTRLQVPDFN
jgi:hypothetical protein